MQVLISPTSPRSFPTLREQRSDISSFPSSALSSSPPSPAVSSLYRASPSPSTNTLKHSGEILNSPGSAYICTFPRSSSMARTLFKGASHSSIHSACVPAAATISCRRADSNPTSAFPITGDSVRSFRHAIISRTSLSPSSAAQGTQRSRYRSMAHAAPTTFFRTNTSRT